MMIKPPTIQTKALSVPIAPSPMPSSMRIPAIQLRHIKNQDITTPVVLPRLAVPVSLTPPATKLQAIHTSTPTFPELATLFDTKGNPIKLDASQLAAVKLALSGLDFCIIGKAGTGKSTIVQAICLLWMARHQVEWADYRVKGQGKHITAPSIAIVAYTNTAADGIRNKMLSHPDLAKDFGYNITTIHNILEYTVEYITDEEGKTKRRYYPQKDKDNKLTITHLVIEEASMLGVGDVSLWQELFDALPSGVQIMLLGDINQLPPVIGKSILAYALQQIPVAELSVVHRTALDNPITKQALRCLEGKSIEEELLPNGDGVKLYPGKQKIKVSAGHYEGAIAGLLINLISTGQFDPYEDMLLSPYYKLNTRSVSAMNLANIIATILAHSAGREVYEIQAGFVVKYLAIGDRVFMDKVEGTVTGIESNSLYTGKVARPASKYMNYDGKLVGRGDDGEEIKDDWLGGHDYTALDIDSMLGSEAEEKKRSASHIVSIKVKQLLDGEEERTVSCSTIGDFASLSLGYAMSVHKAQGSEWPRTIIALHDSNANMLFRELIYTAMTRARGRVSIIAQPHVLQKAIATQRIKGNSLAEKIEYFNGGYLDQIVPISKRDQTAFRERASVSANLDPEGMNDEQQ